MTAGRSTTGTAKRCREPVGFRSPEALVELARLSVGGYRPTLLGRPTITL